MIGAYASPAAARAELSCADFTRGVVLQDPDVLSQAGAIAHPWFRASQALAATAQGAKTPDAQPPDAPNGFLAIMFMTQLAQECQALPNDTVDRIVATHLKITRGQIAALAQKNAAKETPPPSRLPGGDSTAAAAEIEAGEAALVSEVARAGVARLDPVFCRLRMPYLPKPLVSCNEAFLRPSICTCRGVGSPHGHEFQDTEQRAGHLDIVLVARMMERDKDLVA